MRGLYSLNKHFLLNLLDSPNLCYLVFNENVLKSYLASIDAPAYDEEPIVPIKVVADARVGRPAEGEVRLGLPHPGDGVQDVHAGLVVLAVLIAA